jgi:hypothetical protein
MCDLCRKEAVLPDDLLCLPCRETIQRVMDVTVWTRHRQLDKDLNQAQVDMLIRAMNMIYGRH